MEYPAQTSLSKVDCESVVRNLDECIAILDKNVNRRPIAEIKVRSMIAVLREEIARSMESGNSPPPFAF